MLALSRVRFHRLTADGERLWQLGVAFSLCLFSYGAGQPGGMPKRQVIRLRFIALFKLTLCSQAMYSILFCAHFILARNGGIVRYTTSFRSFRTLCDFLVNL